MGIGKQGVTGPPPPQSTGEVEAAAAAPGCGVPFPSLSHGGGQESGGPSALLRGEEFAFTLGAPSEGTPGFLLPKSAFQFLQSKTAFCKPAFVSRPPPTLLLNLKNIWLVDKTTKRWIRLKIFASSTRRGCTFWKARVVCQFTKCS